VKTHRFRFLACLLAGLLGLTARTVAQGGLGQKGDAGERDGGGDGVGKHRVPPPPTPPPGPGSGTDQGSPRRDGAGGAPRPQPASRGGGACTRPGGAQAATPASSPAAPGPWSGPREPIEWWDWWARNRELYLDVDPAPGTGPRTPPSDETLAEYDAREAARRSAALVPVFLGLLAVETDERMVREALLGLGRVGQPRDSARAFEAIVARLADSNAATAEAAVVALGVLGGRDAVLALGELCLDAGAGAARVDDTRVPVRMRALAAYGVGLATRGTGESHAELRRYAVHVLGSLLAERDAPEELQAAAVIAMGLAPVPGRSPADPDAPPSASLAAEVRFLLDVLGDAGRPRLARCHAPTAIARLVASDRAEVARDPGLRADVAEALFGALSAREDVSLRRSALLALGEVATAGGDALDGRMRSVLLEGQRTGELLSRRFATLALARCGARPGPTRDGADPFLGVADVERALLQGLARGKSAERTWCALGLGVLGHGLRAHGERLSVAAADALLHALAAERNPAEAAAYALGLGLIGDARAVERTREALERASDEEFQSLIAVGLGLLQQRSALEPLARLSAENDHRPRILEASGLARALIGDPDLVGEMLARSEACDCATSLAGAAGALARSEDGRAIAPLSAFALDPERPLPSRVLAVRALAWIGQRDELPWETRVVSGLDYVDAPSTLTDPGGYGMIDL